MPIIENIESNNFTLTFEINNKENNIYTSLVNAIRRTILTDIKTWCIDFPSVQYFENTSVLDNEFITNRLTLVPIRCDLENVDYESIKIECRKRNDEEEIMSVYVSDFVVKDKNNNIIDNNLLFPYTKIVLLQLRHQQSIAFEGTLIQGSIDEDLTSVHCPVCTCVHTFIIDENKVREKTNGMTNEEKRNFNTMNAEREYIKNVGGEPGRYKMTIETIGQFDSRDLVKKSFDLLKNRLNRFINDLKVNNERIQINNGEIFEDILEISIDNETDTLGNLISNYAGLDEDVLYSGYVIRHPLKKNILLKIKLNENNTYEQVIQKYEKVVQDVNSIIDTMSNEFV